MNIKYAPSLDCFSPNAMGVGNAFEALAEASSLYFINGELKELAFFEPASSSDNLLAGLSSLLVYVTQVTHAADALPSLYVDTMVVSPAMLAVRNHAMIRLRFGLRVRENVFSHRDVYGYHVDFQRHPNTLLRQP